MRQYITGRKRLTIIAFAVSLFILHACMDDADKIDEKKNLSLMFSTRAGETAAGQIPTMRLFTFHNNPGNSNDKKFRQEIQNLTRGANEITAQVETGQWNMTLVSTPNGGTILSPNTTVPMAELPMYKYTPTLSGGRSSNAHEIYLDNRLTPTITSGGSVQMSAQLNRTVAKVELIIKKTTPNFNLSGTHNIKLHHIPSTLSYTGALLPNKTNPDTLVSALQAPVVLVNGGTGSYEGTETISFVIPAHRGSDYVNTAPVDTTTQKMKVTVDLERTGGTRFTKQAEISYVAKANKILRVYVTVNDGLEFETDVLPWEGVDLSSTVGAGYQNWLYVKKGATGSGLSWSDPLPNINSAITKANALTGAGKTVNGILVAGGSDTGMLYSESFTLPANMKIYGGWVGTSGTELTAAATTADVYSSTNRNIKTHKVCLATGTGNVVLSGANAVLDGFVVSGSGSSSVDGLVTISNATAWANAIEIDQQTISSTYALAMSAGTGTNILVSRNTKGVSVGSSGKLINATIANNTVASAFSGTLLNSIYWGNTGTATTTGTINYCAFQGTAPSGTNYPLNNTNNAWFTNSTISVPGPQFNQTANSAQPYYAVSTSTPNRAPQLARANQAAFDNETTGMPAAHKSDIYGNPRHHEGTDIGCYESTGSQKGFKFQWNMSDIYISPKAEIESDHPALLFNNSEGAYVAWEIEATSIINSKYSVISGYTSGSGNTVELGQFRLKSGSSINTGSTDSNCGSITLKCTNLNKAYFPDELMTVYQTPSSIVVWTAGYAGSFHRWNETEPRYVFGANSGNWTARIINGHSWIKIDGQARPANPNNDTEVEETFGGVVSGNGNIVFRVGMKSKLTNADSQPRYGLISITRTSSGVTGVALFFVRQGEAADYLYGPNDARPLGARTGAIKFSPYNLIDGQKRFSASGVSLGQYGGSFTDYPSKAGYFFKWNSYVAYYPDNSVTGTSMGNTFQSGNWDNANEPCPNGYFTPTDEQFVHSFFLNRAPANSGSGSAVGTTFVWGRLADGYYDKIASTGGREIGSGPDRATEGLLMYNDYNNASVFFPMAGYRSGTSTNFTDYIQWTQTSSPRGSNYMWHTHNYGTGTTGHLGMSCTPRSRYDGLSVRCVKQ